MTKQGPVCAIVHLIGGIGALNWLLVTWFNFNLVGATLGDGTVAAKAVYTVVGVAGALLIIAVLKGCKSCAPPAA